MHRRLSRSNKLLTPGSGTTVFINYSYELKILEALFTGSPKIYHYLDVEDSVWEEYKDILKSGGSSGTFMNTRIKPNYDVVVLE